MSQLFVDNIKNRTGGAIGAPSGAVVTGIVTATGLDINGTADISGNVSIGGTLTYEDVTNIDSLGIVTARTGVRVNAGGLVVTAGVSTLAADLSIADKIVHTGDTNTAIRFPAADTFTVETDGSERLRIDSTGRFFFNESTSDLGSKYIFSGNESSNVAAFQYNNNTGTYLSIKPGDADGVVELLASARSGANPALTFNTGGSERLRLTSAGAAIFKGGLAEKYENAGTTLNSQPNNPLSDGNVILFTGNESGNKTINFTGVHSTLSNGETVSFTAIITPNNSGKITVVQVDGQTPAGGLKWSGGSAPSAGSSGQDIYTFQILKTGTANTAYTVYGAATNYA